MIYYPDPGKDFKSRQVEEKFRRKHYSWSPSTRTLCLAYREKRGRTYIILKGVSKEQFIRCVHFPLDGINTITGKFVAEPSYRGIMLRGIGVISNADYFLNPNKAMLSFAFAYPKSYPKPMNHDYYLNAISGQLYIRPRNDDPNIRTREYFYIGSLSKLHTEILDFVLPNPASSDLIKKKKKVITKDPETEEFEIVVDDKRYMAIKNTLYHISRKKEKGHRKVQIKEHRDEYVKPFIGIEEECFYYRKKVKELEDKIVLNITDRPNSIGIVTTTKEEINKQLRPKDEIMLEEIAKYPKRRVTRIKNKYGFDDSYKGIYNLLVKLRRTDKYNIKQMREEILDELYFYLPLSHKRNEVYA